MISESVAVAFVGVSSIFLVAALIRPLVLLRWYWILRPCITPFAYWAYAFPGGVPIGTPYLGVLTFGGFASMIGTNKRIMPSTLIWLFLMLIFSVPSCIIAPDLAEGFTNYIKVIGGMSAYLIAYNCINSKKDLKYILVTIAILTPIVPLAFGAYQYVTATGNMFTHIYHDPKRIASVFAMYNHFGEFLNIVTFILLGMILSNEFTKQKKILLLILVIVCVESLLAQNRGSWVGLVLGLFVSMFVYRRVMPLRLVIIGGTLLALLAGTYITARFAMLTELSQYGATQDTLSGRLDMGVKLLESAMESPFTGNGLGFVSTVLSNDPHNDYLWIFVENGLFAAVMYIFFNIGNILIHLRNRRTSEWRWIQFSFCGIAVYFFIHSFFQNIIFNPSSFPFFMTCFGAAAKLMHIKEEPAESSILPQDKHAHSAV